MRIFISYQTLDAAIAKAVVDEIKAHRPNVDLFFAPETLSAGAYWLPRLAQEIKDSHAVLLLIGKPEPVQMQAATAAMPSWGL